MGRAYYYLISSLPTLSFEGLPPLTVENFKEDCSRLLADQDYLTMLNVLDDRWEALRGGNEFVSKWVQFQKRFRNTIAFYRAQKYGKDPQEYMRGDKISDLVIYQVVQNADKADNPLEGEIILGRYVWNILEEMLTGMYFSFENVLGYGIKLKMLERFHSIKLPTGQKKLEEYKKIDASVLLSA